MSLITWYALLLLGAGERIRGASLTDLIRGLAAHGGRLLPPSR